MLNIPYQAAQMVKNHLQCRRPRFAFVGQEDSLEKGMASHSSVLGASLVAQTVKNLLIMQETWARFLIGKISWRRKWLLTPVFLPGEIPWTEEPGGLQSTGSESDTTDD